MTTLFHPTVARLTVRELLGRRRAVVLAALPAVLVLLALLVRLVEGADDRGAVGLLGGFGVAAIVPLVALIAGTGAIAPEIDDGSIVHLLSKPVARRTVMLTKYLVAVGVTLAFTVPAMLVAGMLLNGNSGQAAVAFAAATAVAVVAYAALFLLLGTVSRNAVVLGLLYTLLWESLLSQVVPGARTLSVQQWATAVAERLADPGVAVSSSVPLVTAAVLVVVVSVGALGLATARLERFSLTGEK